jgi:hypothetical protein
MAQGSPWAVLVASLGALVAGAGCDGGIVNWHETDGGATGNDAGLVGEAGAQRPDGTLVDDAGMPGSDGRTTNDGGGDAGATDGPTGGGGTGLDFTPGRRCTAQAIAGAPHVTGGDLAGAIAGMANDSTLVVDDGNYSGSLDISNKENVTICAAPGVRPVISSDDDADLVFVSNSSYVHFEGFELSGHNDASHSSQGGIVIGPGTHHIAVWDTWIHDVPSAGIGGALDSGGHLDVRYNRIWNAAAYNSYQQSAITFYELDNYGGANDTNGYSDYIIGNMIFASGEWHISDPSDGNCIIIDDNKITQGYNRTGPPYEGRTLIANNLCAANGGRGVHVFESAHVDVVNNTVFHDLQSGYDGLQGELDASESDDVRFVNNLSIAVDPGNVFDSWGLGQNVELSNNVFSGRANRQPPGGFTMVGDPMLVNPTADPRSGDFRPAAGSPVIGAGAASYANVPIPKVDFLGRARPAAPSAGAFEP